MNVAFIVTLNIEGDTDLIGISDDLRQLIDGDGQFQVVQIHPWARETLPPTGQTPPVAPAN